MDLKVYNELCFYDEIVQFEKECFHRLTSYHWESEPPYRPMTFFKVGVVSGNLVAVLKCYEENPRTLCVNRDDPVYTDSCLEFFVAPVDGRDEYINIEMNSKGVYLSEFGKGKYDRVLISTLTDKSPLIEPFNGKDINGTFWGVKVTLTKEFICELYNVVDFNYTKIKANFYKCGDNCETPHYLAFSPVTTLPPGFHNPECFAVFMKRRTENDSN